MDKEKTELVEMLRRLIPAEIRWENLSKHDLQALVRLAENPRDAAILFGARAVQNRAKDLVDNFFNALAEEVKQK